MTKLVIVESPAKAKTISRFLGKDYRVEASYGHVRDLPTKKSEVPEQFRKEAWAEFGVNTEANFEPVYIVTEGKKKQIAALRKALKEADELLLATDEDREGESISWHLRELLDPKHRVPTRRIVFHEITREAIEAALANPRDVDEDLVHAQESRRILDRLFGYKLSPILWRKVRPRLSAGRVQSVAVRLIVEREEERRTFVQSEYWNLEAEFSGPTGTFKAALTQLGDQRLATGKDFDPNTGQLSRRNVLHLDEKTAGDLLGRLRGALPWTVANVEEKPATQRPYPPFTTSTLQQEANRKLGFPSAKTMRIAQRLYEGVDLGGNERVGLITYMRTDSTTLSQKALNDAQAVIRKNFGDDYAKGSRVYKTKQRNAQEAHEAIRPTEISRFPGAVARYLDRDDLALYELIWKRTLASQMPDARLLRTSVDIAATDSESGTATFNARGKKILFPGFLRAYVEGSDDPSAEIGDQEVILPDLQPGQSIPAEGDRAVDKAPVLLANLESRRSTTNPPARYTEASLVKKLEEESIGRPSTYASIISTIQDRGYVYLGKSRQLIPTFTALVVVHLLKTHFPEYIDIRFTANLEEELDVIAEGKMDWVDYVSRFYRGSNGHPGLESLVESKVKTIEFPTIALGSDPDTGEPIRLRVGKYGPFLQRGENGNATNADVPETIAPEELTLDKALDILNHKQEGPRVLGTDPATGQAVYATIGRFGPYVQLGEAPDEDDKTKTKPKRASLEKGMTLETVTLEQALQLLSFPRDLGRHPETGEAVLVNKGRFGPYVAHGKDNRSLRAGDDPNTVTLERALELLAEPKGAGRRGTAAKTVLKELGEHDGAKLQVLEGRYGPYVSDGKKNATLPKGLAPDDVTMEKAVELLAAKKGGAKKPSPRKKASPKKGK